MWVFMNQEFDLGCIKFELSGEHPDSFFLVFTQLSQLLCSSR